MLFNPYNYFFWRRSMLSDWHLPSARFQSIIRSERYEYYGVTEEYGNLNISKDYSQWVYREFPKENKLQVIFGYNNVGIVSQYFIDLFDDGRVQSIERETILKDKTIKVKEAFEYDNVSLKRIQLSGETDLLGMLTGHDWGKELSLIKIDREGEKVRFAFYDETNKWHFNQIIKLDESNNISQIFMKQSGKIETINPIFNEKNELQRYIYFGSVIDYDYIEYDSKNNWTKCNVYLDGRLYAVADRSINYYLNLKTI